MADTRSTTEREAARNRAQKHFTSSEQRDAQVRQQIEGERTAVDAKTAKLKAMRLAREEEDRVIAANAPPVKAKKAAAKPRVKKA